VCNFGLKKSYSDCHWRLFEKSESISDYVVFMLGAGGGPQAPVAEGGPAALEGTLSPLPTLEDSLPPLLGLRPATRRKYPPGPPSEIRVLRRGEPTGLVPRGAGAKGSFLHPIE